MKHRTRLLVLLAILVSAVGATAAVGLLMAAPSEVSRPLEADQWIEIQVVSVPTQSVIGGLEYSEDAVHVHSAHVIAVPAHGSGQTIRSVVDGLPIDVHWTRVAMSPERDAIRIDDLQFGLGMRFQISETERLRSVWTSPGRAWIDIGRAFMPVGSIHYREDTTMHTFVRARWLAKGPEEPVVAVP